ncbi:hypothetical protein MNV49_005361 [Pseudohyphozyma bogoriensis]|nr:hypothetical protein MNV49_005361 [Pseudohyphozyma bogoriensis]
MAKPLVRSFTIGKEAVKIPAIGLGTWQSPKGEVRNAVSVAIKAGYRHIDCAAIYGNEAEVADGIKDSGVDRKQLWLTSKLWNTHHSPDKVEPALDASLKRLGTDYLDLYLIHWPVAFKDAPSKQRPDQKIVLDDALTKDPMPTWRAMEELVKKGKVKYIGISNFTIEKAQKLYDAATIKPTFNQVELNPACAQPELLAWAKKTGIILEAYSPLGSTGAVYRDDPVFRDIAKEHGVDPANILISWQVERGCVVLPKSVTPSRIISNFIDVKLKPEELAKIDEYVLTLPQVRQVDPSKGWGVKIFDDSVLDEKAKL